MAQYKQIIENQLKLFEKLMARLELKKKFHNFPVCLTENEGTSLCGKGFENSTCIWIQLSEN